MAKSQFLTTSFILLVIHCAQDPCYNAWWHAAPKRLAAPKRNFDCLADRRDNLVRVDALIREARHKVVGKCLQVWA